MESILKVTGLNKSYKNFSIRDVSFSVPEGSIAGLVGVNGAGKTTTLRTILGIAGRDSGNIEYFGMDFDRHARQIKDRIGVMLDGIVSMKICRCLR